MGEMRNACKIFVENLEGRVRLEDLGTDGRIILEWTLEKKVGRCELDTYSSG
jgi:hypothetical protein